MMRKDLLIRKTRTLLSEFLSPLVEQVDKPRKRFLQQAIRGILFSGSLVEMEFGRWVRDDCSDRFYRVKRLLNHLVSPEGDLTAAASGYRQAASVYLAADTAKAPMRSTAVRSSFIGSICPIIPPGPCMSWPLGKQTRADR